ncbi:MAG: signal recognition particle-docking protein FtsY [Bdellovibrio sp.]|nr:signal recognition particle-docking protein FtsY [Bdellovibrio sp.]
MSESHFDQMTILLVFIGVLFLAVMGTVVLSIVKKRKTPSITPNEAVPVPVNDVTVGADQLEEARLKDIADRKAVVKEEETNITIAEALAKTEESFFGRIRKAFSNADKKLVLDEVEEVLYTSDLGPQTVERLLDVIKSELSSKQISDINTVKWALEKEMMQILKPVQGEFEQNTQVKEQITKAPSGPTVLMVVGVNGAGKTTSIGKITSQLATDGFKILVAAGDTFRAAAGGQLKVWTDRASASASAEGQVEIFWPSNTTDPSAVAFDAIQKAKAQNFDYVILDTAGRLHTQSHLMDELKKVKRVMAKVIPEAPHETWIVLDANSGQNALMQAKEYNAALGVTGCVLTKMDGTAKGGVALAVVDQLKIPIKLIGVGEKVSDLRLFKYEEYVKSILGIH